jgi:UTP:GlnB (protein PII) uridylyltransferase
MSGSDHSSFIASISPPPSLDSLPEWGFETAAALTRAAESAIAPILDRLDPAAVGVYAIGGFGRRELAPFSDLDLLFVTETPDAIAEAVAELWRPGLKPSVMIRSAAELTSGEIDLLFATSLLDARPLFGRVIPLFENARALLERRPAFIAEHEAEAIDRHRRFAGVGRLEPHLRDGRGGLRDLQLQRWLALAADAPIPARPRDYGLLLAGRIVIHLALGRREDRLIFSERAAIAAWLGWRDPSAFFRAMLKGIKRNAAAGGAVAPGDSDANRLRPGRIHDPRRPFSVWLRARDANGTLARNLPEWTEIESLPDVEPIHRHTPDEHTLRVIEEVETLLGAGNGPIAPEMITRPEPLLLAALFHDIAKARPGDHETEGASIARRRLAAWSFDAVEIATVAFLVENHLILSYHAFFRDIDEPALIHDLAERFENVEDVALLHLLTVADLKAVSPEHWTEWKGRLLRTLTTRLMRQCAHRLPPAHIATEAIARRRGAVEALLPAPDQAAAIARHFDLIDARYALAHPPETIVRHLGLLPGLDAAPVVLERCHLAELGVTEIVVVTRSHLGLFAEIAGVLAARGLNILGADISTRRDEIAIDTFRIADRRDATLLDDARWRSLGEDLRRVLTGEIAVEKLLLDRRPYLDRGPRPASRTCRIAVDRESSPSHTIVEVTAPDEIGLLHRIATAFRDCGVSISSAIVMTSGGAAADVFYVSTDDGGKEISSTALAAFERKIEES